MSAVKEFLSVFALCFMLFWGGATAWYMIATGNHNWFFWAMVVTFIAYPVLDIVDDIRYSLLVRKIKSGKVK